MKQLIWLRIAYPVYMFITSAVMLCYVWPYALVLVHTHYTVNILFQLTYYNL